MTDESIIVGGVLVMVLAVVILAVIYLRYARRRRREAWHRYFHGGGLIRTLMSRWSRTARLTDQRPTSEREQD